jgi:hypothetical protein
MSCQKQVIDFTGMTDTELVSYFKTYAGGGCGRFTEEQIGREIRIPSLSLPWMKYFFRITLPAFLLFLKSSAHAQKTITPIEVAPVKPVTNVEPYANQFASLKGQIVDEQNTPIAGASVLVIGTARGTSTDTSGRFILNVTPGATLNVMSVGYESKEIKVDSIAHDKPIILTLAPSTLLGEVLVVGAVVTQTRSRLPLVKKTSRPAKQESIVAFPNPVLPGTKINIQCNRMAYGKYITEIYTVAGQVLQSSTCSYNKHDKKVSLNVGQLTPGIYIVRLTHIKSGKLYSQEIAVRE